MNKLILAVLTIATLVLVGCGGNKNSNTTTLKAEINIKKRFNYFHEGNFTQEKNTLVCHKGLYGDSYTIHISIYDGNIRFETHEHRKNDCSDEPFNYIYSSYEYELGNESADTTRVDISLVNESFNYNKKDFEIESMVSKLVFGHVILGNTYYTSVVGAGDIRTEKIKLAFAHPSSENNGSSVETRAKDISNYIEDKFYFLED